MENLAVVPFDWSVHPPCQSPDSAPVPDHSRAALLWVYSSASAAQHAWKCFKSENSENFKNTPNPISKWNLWMCQFTRALASSYNHSMVITPLRVCTLPGCFTCFWQTWIRTQISFSCSGCISKTSLRTANRIVAIGSSLPYISADAHPMTIASTCKWKTLKSHQLRRRCGWEQQSLLLELPSFCRIWKNQVPLSACSSLAQSFVLLLVLRWQLSVLAVFQAHCRPAPVQIQLNWVMKQKSGRQKVWKALKSCLNIFRCHLRERRLFLLWILRYTHFWQQTSLRLIIRIHCPRIFENRLSTIQTPLLSQPLLFQWYYLLKIVCRQAPILSLRGCVVKSTWEYLRSFRQRTRVNDFIPLCIDHMMHICLHGRIRKLGSAIETLWEIYLLSLAHRLAEWMQREPCPSRRCWSILDTSNKLFQNVMFPKQKTSIAHLQH